MCFCILLLLDLFLSFLLSFLSRLACLTLLLLLAFRCWNDFCRCCTPNLTSAPSKTLSLPWENKHVCEHHVSHAYLLPDVSGTPFCFDFASPRRSWRTSGTLLGCCQASPKCLPVLLGRFSAALGSLLRLSCSLMSSSLLA